MKSTATSFLILLSPFLSLTTANPIDLDESLSPSHPLISRSEVNGTCTGSNGELGLCISASTCSSAGGTFINDGCPGTPDGIGCCEFDSSPEETDLDEADLDEVDLEEIGVEKRAQTVGQKVLAKAMEAKGTPYHYGGGSCSGKTGGGFDCSGLVSWAVCKVTGRNFFSEGLRVTYNMYCSSDAKRKFKKVPYSQRRAGDAVFFGGKCDCSHGWSNSNVHHVGLMMNSGTKMWNALKTGTKVRADDYGSWGEKPCPYVIRFS